MTLGQSYLLQAARARGCVIRLNPIPPTGSGSAVQTNGPNSLLPLIHVVPAVLTIMLNEIVS